jgi:hypothetical protein
MTRWTISYAYRIVVKHRDTIWSFDESGCILKESVFRDSIKWM